MEEQVQTQETSITKKEKSPLLIILVIIILLLAGVIAYMYFRPSKIVSEKKDETSGETTLTQEETGTQTTGTEADTQTTGTQADTTGGTGTTTTKADIDNDLKSVDSLNLSEIENDYGEDNVNDLTQ